MAFKDIVTAGDKKTNGWLSLIIGIVIIIIIVIVLWKIYTSVKTAANSFGETLGDVTISQTFGVDVARVSIIKQAATDCYNSIYHIWPTSVILYVDTTKVINALNTLTSDAEVKLCCVYYKQSAGESLKLLVDSPIRFNDSMRAQITFYSSIV